MIPCERASGFTLIEVVVAMALTGVLALLAHATLTGIIDGRERAAELRGRLDSVMIARSWAQAAVASIDVTAGGFEGRTDSAAFTTWLPVAEGFLRRQRATIVRTGGLVALRTDARDIPLATGVSGLAIDYLTSSGLDARFAREWSSPVAAPLAIRLRMDRTPTGIDTLLLLVGPRG